MEQQITKERKDNDQKTIFLSYSRNDEEIADRIYRHLSSLPGIQMKRDVRDISPWESIRVFMESIRQQDYAVLIISDSYLKSENCMFEVTEMMKEQKYKERIFPAVVEPGIYKPCIRAEYIKYWQNECDRLEAEIQELKPESAIKLIEVLKQYKDICYSVGEFLATVADMNNPDIQKVELQIEKAILEAENNAAKKIIQPPVHPADTENTPCNNTVSTKAAEKAEPWINPNHISLELVARQIEELKGLYITAENTVRKCEYATSDAADWVAYYKKERKKARKKAKQHLEITQKNNGSSEIAKAEHEEKKTWNIDIQRANEALSQAYDNLGKRKKALREAKTQSAFYKKELSAVINLHNAIVLEMWK